MEMMKIVYEVLKKSDVNLSWEVERKKWNSITLLNFTIEFIYFNNLVSDTIIAADLSTLMTKVLQQFWKILL